MKQRGECVSVNANVPLLSICTSHNDTVASLPLNTCVALFRFVTSLCCDCSWAQLFCFLIVCDVTAIWRLFGKSGNFESNGFRANVRTYQEMAPPKKFSFLLRNVWNYMEWSIFSRVLNVFMRFFYFTILSRDSFMADSLFIHITAAIAWNSVDISWTISGLWHRKQV